MIMTPSVRKFVLTSHVTFSVGWLGAVAGFLVPSIAGLTSHNVDTARAVICLLIIIVLHLTGYGLGPH